MLLSVLPLGQVDWFGYFHFHLSCFDDLRHSFQTCWCHQLAVLHWHHLTVWHLCFSQNETCQLIFMHSLHGKKYMLKFLMGSFHVTCALEFNMISNLHIMSSSGNIQSFFITFRSII